MGSAHATGTLTEDDESLILINDGIRHTLDSTGRVDAGEDGLRRGQDRVASAEFVLVFQFGHRRAGDFRAECQLVVVAGGGEKLAFKFCHDKEETGLFNFAIATAGCSEEFCAAHFEICEIVGVMQVAHGVGFDVADADLNFVLF